MDHGCIQYVFLIHVLYSSQFTVQVKVLPDPVRNVDEIPLTTICYDHDTQCFISCKYGIAGEWPPCCMTQLHGFLSLFFKCLNEVLFL